MRRSVILAIGAFTGIVQAQDFSGQPACAIPCLKEALPKAGCALTDQACQCDPSTQKQLINIVAGCLTTSCTPKELFQAQDAASSACAAFSATAVTGSATTLDDVITATSTLGTSAIDAPNTSAFGTYTTSAQAASITTSVATSAVVDSSASATSSSSVVAGTTSKMPTTVTTGGVAAGPTFGAFAAALAAVLAL